MRAVSAPTKSLSSGQNIRKPRWEDKRDGVGVRIEAQSFNPSRQQSSKQTGRETITLKSTEFLSGPQLQNYDLYETNRGWCKFKQRGGSEKSLTRQISKLNVKKNECKRKGIRECPDCGHGRISSPTHTASPDDSWIKEVPLHRRPLTSEGFSSAMWLNSNRSSWLAKGAGFRNFVPLNKPENGLHEEAKPLKFRLRKPVIDRIARVYVPRPVSTPPRMENCFEIPKILPTTLALEMFEEPSNVVPTSLKRSTSSSHLLGPQPVEFLPPHTKSAVRYKVHYRDRLTNEEIDVSIFRKKKSLQSQTEIEESKIRQLKSSPTALKKNGYYSFLIGGRYTSAHSIDNRSLETNGVYISKAGTHAGFVRKTKKQGSILAEGEQAVKSPFVRQGVTYNGRHSNESAGSTEAYRSLKKGGNFCSSRHEDFHFKYNYVVKDEFYNDYLRKYYQFYGAETGLFPRDGRGVRVIDSKRDINQDLRYRGQQPYATGIDKQPPPVNLKSRNIRLKPMGAPVKWLGYNAKGNYLNFRPKKLVDKRGKSQKLEKQTSANSQSGKNACGLIVM
eukprot:Nk52_evm10s2462 gene=Nk52_evmTU10s2462